MELVISVIALLVSLATFVWEYRTRRKEHMKNEMLSYFLDFYQPVYPAQNLPTTLDVYQRFKVKSNKSKMYFYRNILVELNLEGKIQLVGTVDEDFMHVRWKPSLNVYKKEK